MQKSLPSNIRQQEVASDPDPRKPGARVVWTGRYVPLPGDTPWIRCRKMSEKMREIGGFARFRG